MEQAIEVYEITHGNTKFLAETIVERMNND